MRQRDLCFYIAGGFFGIGLALAYAQPAPDAAKLAPVYRQQREAQSDGWAQCFTGVIDLQARIAELEKQLAAAKAASEAKPN